MSKIVKFFSKKSSSNKENQHDNSLKRVNFERASTRSEVGGSSDAQRAERERQAMRAIANPYSVWTEPKNTRGPSSCPGVALDSSAYFSERRSVRQPKHERAGSVYGDMASLRQYRIDGPPDGGNSSRNSDRGSVISAGGGSRDYSNHHHHHQQQRASRRYGGDLSMIEERSERSSVAERSGYGGGGGGDWARSSQRPRAPPSYIDYTSGDSDEEDAYVRKLEARCQKLHDDKRRYRSLLEKNKSELEYCEYELKQALERNEQMERGYKREVDKMQRQLMMEREKRDILEQRLSEMSSSTSNGAMERLVSSSETSLEMEEGEEGGGERMEEEDDEVRNFRGCGGDSQHSSSATAAASAAASTTTASSSAAASERSSLLLQRGGRGAAAAAAAADDDERMEVTRRAASASPQFELRRSASDMGPVTMMIDGAGEEMAVMEGAGVGGSWRRQRERRRSFIKRPFLAAPQESESSDGEKIQLTERQLKKRGAVVKFDPNRRVHVKEKHYRRFGKPERSALEDFTFLEQEVTDISGMLSSPNEGNY